MLNYRANIVIFHEIVPLSARSSKIEDAKRVTGAREMAKTDRKTGGRRGCNSWHLLFRSAANRAPPEARRRSGSGRSARAGQAESQRGEIAEPPLRSLAQRRSDRKKEEQTAQALGIFSTYRGAFHPSPPPRSTPTPTQEARAEKPTKKLSHARATPSFCFFPSPIDSNSVVHKVLRVKISNILTHRKQPTTTSASTPCR